MEASEAEQRSIADGGWIPGNPALGSAYKRRIIALALLGYAYLAGIFVALLALFAAVGWLVIKVPILIKLGFKAAVPVLILFYAVVRSLWVKVPEPAGLPLSRQEAPALFEALAHLRARLNGPRIHRVLLTDDLNAAIVQAPRLGLLGLQRNYLIVGMPLMLALSPKQFGAVLAHEYGHLSGAHGRLSAWIYRLRQSWAQLAMALESTSAWSGWLFSHFFNWYVPYFGAASFALARSNEFDADRCSAEFSGTAIVADALVSTAVKSRCLEDGFWADYWRQADTTKEPPALPFRQMKEFLAAVPHPEMARQALADALDAGTDLEDTHPCLGDRLKALGRDPRLPEALDCSAADRLLGSQLAPLLDRCDTDWYAVSRPYWENRYRESMFWRRDLHALTRKAAAGTLTGDERWRRATLTRALDGEDAACPLYRAILNDHPDHAGANYALGQILIDGGDTAGLSHIDTAMALDEGYVLQGCELAYDCLRKAGREAEAEAYLERASTAQARCEQMLTERNSLDANDTFRPHGISAEAIAESAENLDRMAELEAVCLVRKDCVSLRDAPCYVLAIRRTGAEPSDEVFFDRFMDGRYLPFDIVLIQSETTTVGVMDTILSTENACVYERGKAV